VFADAVGDFIVLKVDPEGAGRGGHDLVELRAVERRHVDALVALEERFTCL
jgi:hypothetical protein